MAQPAGGQVLQFPLRERVTPRDPDPCLHSGSQLGWLEDYVAQWALMKLLRRARDGVVWRTRVRVSESKLEGWYEAELDLWGRLTLRDAAGQVIAELERHSLADVVEYVQALGGGDAGPSR